MNPNVLQHQYAVSRSGQNDFFLSTKGILICTGWYGWDTSSGISFLCHFDHPCSAESVPEILRSLGEMAPQDHSFRSVLVGGKEWFWSKRTRARIRAHVGAQDRLKIKVKDGPMDGWLCKHRNLVVSVGHGH